MMNAKKGLMMKPRLSLLFLISLFLCFPKIFPRSFVCPTCGDTIGKLLCKIGATLDQRRSAIGELISTSTTISSPGFYVLTENIDCPIIIDSDDVWLDLNNYMVTDTLGTCTTITIAQGHKNIVIKNGSLKSVGEPGSSSSGILIEDDASLVNIENVDIFDFETGIYFDGSETGTVKACKVKDVTIMGCNKGIFGTYLLKTNFEQVEAKNCIESGFELGDSWYNVFEKCKALETSNDELEKSAVGFKSKSGRGNLFTECVAEGTTKTTGNFGFNAVGFLLTGSDNKAGEIESKIINCVANSSDTTLTNSCVAYGIQLDMVVKDTIFSADPFSIGNPSGVRGIDWSPQGQFIAVGGGSTPNFLQILHFDGENLIEVEELNSGSPHVFGRVNSPSWSPDGSFVAFVSNAVTGDELFVYKFNPYGDTKLEYVDSEALTSGVRDVDWSPDGRYLCVADALDDLLVYRFDGFNLTFVESESQSLDMFQSRFSPDGKFIAVGYNPGAKSLEIFRFDPLSTNVLDSRITSIAYADDMLSIDWSPIYCGNKYLVAVGGNLVSGKNLEIFVYDDDNGGGSPTLTSLETKQVGTGLLGGLKWSPNGKYLFVTAQSVRAIYRFDASASAGSRLILEGSTSLNLAYQIDVDWSPDGKYVVSEDTTAVETLVDEVANVCSKNKIENNNICNCRGGLGGIGIEGASGTNLIIKNIGYENGINFSEGIFNQYRDGLLGVPSLLDNISVPPYDGSPDDTEGIKKRLEAILCKASSVKVEVGGMLSCCNNVSDAIDLITGGALTVCSKLDELIESASKVDFINDCCTTVDSKVDEVENYTSLVANFGCNMIFSTTTITQPGRYCLGDNIDGYVCIDSDSVTLNMNGFDIHSTDTTLKIEADHKNIVIFDGSVRDAYHGILIKEGVELVKIENVDVWGCENGIYFDGLSTATIKSCQVKHCNVSDNNKGVVANWLAKSVFENCQAFDCSEAGFEIQNSSFNVFDKCKALKIENDIASKSATGFLAISGQGNMFTECICEGIEKTASDFGANASGFVFKGTALKAGETESKILHCIVDSTKIVGDGNAYGIHFDMVLRDTSSFDVLSQAVTSTQRGARNNSVSWSPEFEYLAIGGADAGGSTVAVYNFDGTSLTLTVTIDTPGQVNAVAWSPRGDFVAVATATSSGKEVFVYKFRPDETEQVSRLLLIDTLDSGDIQSLSWNPSAKFLAIGIDSDTVNQLQVWGFDRAKFSTSVIASVGGEDVHSISFSPDGKYIAAVYENLRVYEFDPLVENPTLSLKATATLSSGQMANEVDWSPIAIAAHPEPVEGMYHISVGSDASASNKEVELFSFDGTSLTSFEAKNIGADVEAVQWSPNGKYLLVAGDSSSGSDTKIFSFDGSTLSPEAAGDFLSSATVYSAKWSPDGRYIVVVGESDSGDDVELYEVGNVPTHCLVECNEVLNSSGGIGAIGYEGSTATNLFIKNIGYENDVNFSSGIWNVYIGGMHGSPTNIENISVPPYEGARRLGIDFVLDAAATVKSKLDILDDGCLTVNSKIDDLNQDLDSLLDKIDTTDSKIDQMGQDFADINSKIDFLGDETATVVSKIDHVFENCDAVNSKVDAIDDKVETISSKTDVAIDNLVGNLTEIFSNLDEFADCCVTVNSKIDPIDETVDTIESKLDLVNDLLQTIDSKIDVEVSIIEKIDSTIDYIKQTGSLIDFDDVQVDTIESKLDEILVCCPTVGSKIDIIDSKVDLLEGCPLAEQITTSTIITNPGLYCLCDNISGYIIIDSDSVYLEMNGFGVDSDTTGTAIHVENNHSHVFIRNGYVSGGYDGILVDSGASIVNVQDVKIFDCVNGINFDGLSTATISCCQVKDCSISVCNKGAVLHHAIKCKFENCKVCNCVFAGFELENSNLNSFWQCKALKTSNSDATSSAVGFSSTDGQSNMFMHCVANGTRKTSSNFGYNSTGFLLQGSEINTYVTNSVATLSENSGDGNAHGIHLDHVLVDSPLSQILTTTDFGTTVSSVSWSPESEYVAMSGSDCVTIYKFDGSTLTAVVSKNVNGQNVSSVAWSANGERVAVSTSRSAHPDPVEGSELFAYRFYPHAINSCEKLFLLDSIETSTTVNAVAWSPDERFLAIALHANSSAEIQVWGFDSLAFSDEAVGTYEVGSDVQDIAFSPDGNFVAAVYGTTLRVFAFDFLDTNALTSKTSISASVGNINSVEFSPIAVSSVGEGKYLIAVSGDGATNQVQIFEYGGATTLSSVATASPGSEAKNVCWSANGRDLLVSSTAVKLYELESNFALTQKGSANIDTESCDWSPSGKYVVAGETIFEVAHAPTKCIVKNNDISNNTGGLGGIGLEGASGKNFIVKNRCYANDINLSAGIFNTFDQGLGAIMDNSLKNISL